MDHLLRQLAPIGDRAWSALDDEARERLEPALAARRLIDLDGPHGWEYSATSLGRVTSLPADDREGVSVAQRRVRPLVEIRCPFTVRLAELFDIERGAADPDLAELDAAAHRIAVTENGVVFHGLAAAGIEGLAEHSPHSPISLGPDVARYPHHVALALESLRDAGVDGPYGLALAPATYRTVVENTEDGGYPLMRHLGEMVGGPMVRAPGLRGGALLSLNADNWRFRIGQDLSLGYSHHDRESAHLYLEETMDFEAVTPEAAVWLRP